MLPPASTRGGRDIVHGWPATSEPGSERAYRASVESAEEAGHRSELELVAVRGALDGRADAEKASDTVGQAHTDLEGPRNDDLIARILIDLSFRLEHRLRQVVDEAAKQLEV